MRANAFQADRAGDTSRSAPVTFTKDVAPIFFTHCGSCHRPSGSAPFSLVTYDAARPRATAIARVTATRTMPPWKAAARSPAFIGQRGLTDTEMAILERWARDGARQGDPSDLPPQPTWNDGWLLGTPDLVLTPSETYTLPATGADRFRVFVLPIPVGAKRYVRGVEFHPDDPRVTHHANILIDRTSTSRVRNTESPALGESGLLAATTEYPSGHLLGWTPGRPDPLLPNDLAWPLEAGTDLVVQLHMVPDGTPRPVRFSVGLYLTSEPPTRTPTVLRLGRRDIDIPAGEREYVTTDAYVLPVDAEVRALKPHAHSRARTIAVNATRPDGSTTLLLAIEDWDFRWQHVFRYVEPVQLPRGTRITMRYTYENSTSRRNPERPPRRVLWGPRSTDEMGDLWLQVLTRDETDRAALERDFQRKWFQAELAGFETLLAREPDDPVLHEEAGLLNLQMGRAKEATSHYRAALQRRSDSALAHFNLATSLMMAGQLAEAASIYREALRIDPVSAPAHNSLGNVLVQMGRADEALTHYRAAVGADPRHAGAHNNLGQLLMSRGELPAAQSAFDKAVDLNPRLPDAHFNLGLLVQALGDAPAAVRHFQSAVSLRPAWDRALTALGWLLATSGDESVRNARQAIEVSERAVATTGRRSADALDALAAAYASAGQFDRALSTEREALVLAAGTPMEAAMRERGSLYEAGRPYRK